MPKPMGKERAKREGRAQLCCGSMCLHVEALTRLSPTSTDRRYPDFIDGINPAQENKEELFLVCGNTDFCFQQETTRRSLGEGGYTT